MGQVASQVAERMLQATHACKNSQIETDIMRPNALKGVSTGMRVSLRTKTEISHC